MTQAVPQAPALPPAVEMLDRDGASHMVPADQAKTAYLSGNLSFIAGQGVPIRVGDEERIVSAEDAGAFFGSAQGLMGSVGSKEAYQSQEAKKHFEALPQQAATFGEGAASGLTFGASDYGLRALGADTDLRAQYNPGTRLAGEIGGALVPLAFSGGGSSAATAASMGAKAGRSGLALVRGAEVAGELGRAADVGVTAAREAGIFGRGLASVGEAVSAPTNALMHVGEGAGSAGRGLARSLGADAGGLAERFAGSVAENAVVGAGYGAGNAISDAALQNTPLTAEKLLMGAGHGAIFGAGLGAAGSLAGAGLGRLARRGADAAEAKAASAVEAAVGKHEGQIEAAASKAASKEAEGLIAKFLRETRDEMAFRSLGAGPTKTNRKAVEEIEKQEIRFSGFKDRVTKVILDEMPESIGLRPGALMSPSQKAEAAAAFVKRSGERLGEIVDRLSATGISPDMSAFRAKAEELAAHAEKQFNGKAVADNIRKNAAELESAVAKNGGDLRALQIQRGRMRSEWDTGRSSLLNKAKDELYGEANKAFAKGGEKAAAMIGEPGALDAWRAANRDYQVGKILEPVAAKGVERFGANRTFGFTEQVMAGVGASAGGGLGAIAMSLGAHVGRRYGADIGARAARAMAEGNVLGALAQATDGRMSAAAAKLAGVGRAAGSLDGKVVSPIIADVDRALDRSKARGTVSDQFAQRHEQMASSIANATAMRAQADAVASHRPDLAQSIAEARMRGEKYLQSIAPAPPAEQGVLAHLNPPRIAPANMDRFLRASRGIDDPLGIVEDMAKGRIDREALKAVQAAYPAVYNELKGAVISSLAERPAGKPLDRQREIALSLLFPDQPVTPSATPAFIRGYQAAMAAAAQTAAPSPPPQQPMASQSKLASSLMTPAQASNQGAQ